MIAETKWTPGPWIARPVSDRRHKCAVVMSADGQVQVACCYINHVDWPTAEDNARLIAAAPDLYAALQDTVEALSHLQNSMGVRVNPPTLENAISALAKARGEQ